MERTAILDADAVIAVSNGTKADILRVYPELQPEKIHVIYNGIDLAEYDKTSDTTALTKYGVDPSRPYVLFVGRITRQKGVTHLVEAIRYLPPDTQVVLCAGAPDTPEIAAEMRQKVAEAKATHPHVVWIEKMVTKPEAIQLYSHAQRFLLPIGLRAVRHYQSGSDGLPRARSRQRHWRNSGSGGGWRNRLPGSICGRSNDWLSVEPRPVCARSCREYF